MLRRVVGSWAIGLILLSGTVACSGDDDANRLSEDMDQNVPEPGESTDDVVTVGYDTPDGVSTSLAAYEGQSLVVNFFASTCVPCVTEMPTFEDVHQDLGEQVTFVGIAMQDKADKAADLVERTGITYDYGLDPDGALFVAMGGVALPTTAFIRPDGSIADVRTAAISEDKLRDLIREHLGVG